MLSFSAILRVEKEQTNTGTGVPLMIYHHRHHTNFSELALRFYLFGSNVVKCHENDRLESPFQINEKQLINNKTWNFFLLNNL